jgi:hypothetical protein
LLVSRIVKYQEQLGIPSERRFSIYKFICLIGDGASVNKCLLERINEARRAEFESNPDRYSGQVFVEAKIVPCLIHVSNLMRFASCMWFLSLFVRSCLNICHFSLKRFFFSSYLLVIPFVFVFASTWFTKRARALEEGSFKIPQIQNATKKQCAIDTVNRYLHKGVVSNGVVFQWMSQQNAYMHRIRVTLNRQFSCALSAQSTFVAFDSLMECLSSVGGGLQAQERQVCNISFRSTFSNCGVFCTHSLMIPANSSSFCSFMTTPTTRSST